MTTFRIDQEPERVPRGLIRWSALVLLIMIVASIGATLLLGRGALREFSPVRSKIPARIDQELFLIPTESEQLQAEAQQRLQSYGWVDRTRGVIHVPIEVAIEAYLAEQKR